MFRKSLLAIAAAATLALGMGAATAPAEARVNLYLGIGGPHYGGVYDDYYQPVSHGHWVKKCKIVKIYDGYYTRKVKKCKNVWVKYPHSYGY
jgi:hypothetical protein